MPYFISTIPLMFEVMFMLPETSMQKTKVESSFVPSFSVAPSSMQTKSSFLGISSFSIRRRFFLPQNSQNHRASSLCSLCSVCRAQFSRSISEYLLAMAPQAWQGQGSPPARLASAYFICSKVTTVIFRSRPSSSLSLDQSDAIPRNCLPKQVMGDACSIIYFPPINSYHFSRPYGQFRQLLSYQCRWQSSQQSFLKPNQIKSNQINPATLLTGQQGETPPSFIRIAIISKQSSLESMYKGQKKSGVLYSLALKWPQLMQGQRQQNWLASLGDYFIGLLGRENLAALLLGLGSILFPLGFIYANEQNFSPFETGVVRGLAVTLCAYFLARQTQSDLEFKSPWNFSYLVLRNSIMVMQGLIFSLAQFYLPLTVASTLNSVSPLFVFIFDYYINGVSINRNQAMGVAASFAGVLLVVNGAPIMVLFDSEFEVDSDFKNYLTKSPLVMTLMSTAMLVAMTFHGYAVVMTKKLINVNSIQINYILGLMILLTSSLGFPYKFSGPTLDVGQLAKGFLACGIPMALGQLTYIASLSLTKNFGAIATMQFMGIVFGYCVSIFRYHERVNFVSATGALLIMAGIARVLMCRSS